MLLRVDIYIICICNRPASAGSQNNQNDVTMHPPVPDPPLGGSRPATPTTGSASPTGNREQPAYLNGGAPTVGPVVLQPVEEKEGRAACATIASQRVHYHLTEVSCFWCNLEHLDTL